MLFDLRQPNAWAWARRKGLLRACLKIQMGPVFAQKPLWRGAMREHPRQWGCDRGATKPEGLLRENPPGGGSFACGLRWLGPYSPP